MALVQMFPGQGAQQTGMGAALFDRYPDIVREADNVLGYSIRDLCLNGPQDHLARTEFTQPALYTVGALSYLKQFEESGRKPDFLMGHSLGEYVALFAANVFDFATGLKLVKRRGELMSRASGGGMLVVIGLKASAIEEIISESPAFSEIDIANLNAPQQVVIAGPQAALEKVGPALRQRGASLLVPLNVSAAFHSRYMKEAAEEFWTFLRDFKFAATATTVIANYSAQPYGGNIADALCEQIHSPVRWLESVHYVLARGASEFQELGPGNVLTKITNQIKAIPLHELPQYFPVRIPAATVLKNMPDTPAKEIPVSAGKAASRRPIAPEQLGDSSFMKEHGVRMAYVAGSMYKGIASKEMVVRMGKSRLLSFLGTGGMTMQQVHDDILYIKSKLDRGEPFGLNLLHNMFKPQQEEDLVDLFLRHGIRHIEASSYTALTSAVVRYRVMGIKSENGCVVVPNKIMAKVSRPEIAEHFLSPPPRQIIDKLLAEGRITREEALLSAKIPMAEDICAEGDSGGHTDCRVSYTLIPALQRLERELRERFGYSKKIRIGSGGGLGTPQAIAAAFTLGADFVLTGSINQCTPEAGTSDLVKDMLAQCNVQDTQMAPAGDMFEIGAKIQVLKRGTLFPARANKLYELYRNHGSWEQIDEKTRHQIENTFFGRPYADVWEETRDYYRRHLSEDAARLERDGKARMASVFRWYFVHTSRLARDGKNEHKANFQIHTGLAIGAFNQWAKGTRYEDWRNRHVNEIAEELMAEAGRHLSEHFQRIFPTASHVHYLEAEHV